MEKTRLRWIWTLVLVLLFCGAGREVYGQRVYGSYVNSAGTKGKGGNAGFLGNPGAEGSFLFQDIANIGDNNYFNFSNIKAVSGQPGTGVGSTEGGSTTAWIELIFNNYILAKQALYIKADVYENIGVNKIIFQAYNFTGGNSVAVGSQKLLSELPVKEGGEFVFSTDVPFNRIRITIETGKGNAGLLGTGLLGGEAYVQMKLYYAYFLDSECHAAINTSFGSNGIALDLLGSGPKVLNPFNAIDDDINTKSTLSLGSGVTIGLGSSVYQDVLFAPTSLVGNGIRIYLRSPQSVVNLNLFSGVKVTVYNGANIVFEKTLDQILGLDLLGLLGGQQLVPVDVYGINSPFDKVRISLGNFLNIGVLSGGMEFNMIQMLPPLPAPVSFTKDICKGDLLILEVNNPNPSLLYKWYLNGNGIGTGSQLQYSTDSLLSISSPYEFVVRSVLLSCTSQESGDSIIGVSVYDKPGKPHLSISDINN